MKNIIQIQDELKNVPLNNLIQYVKNPTGQVPSFLALSEIKRRKDMESRYAAQKTGKETSVAQELTNQPQGLSSLPTAQPQSEGVAGLPTGDMYNEKSYAGGGIVAFDDGGEVEHFAYGGPSVDTSMYQPQYYKDVNAVLAPVPKELTLEEQVNKMNAASKAFGVDPEFFKTQIAANKAAGAEDLETAQRMTRANILFSMAEKLGTTPGSLLRGLAAAGPAGGKAAMEGMTKEQEIKRLQRAADLKLMEAQQAQARGDAQTAMKALDDHKTLKSNIELKNAELRTTVDVANAKGRASGAGSQEKLNNMILTRFNQEFLGTYPQGSAETVFQGNPQFLQQEKNRILKNARDFVMSGKMPEVPAETQFEDMYKKNKPVISGTPKKNIIDVPGKGKFRQIGPDEYEPVTEDEDNA